MRENGGISEVVNGDNLDARIINNDLKGIPANAAETVYCNANHRVKNEA
jgi:hypothetical protein